MLNFGLGAFHPLGCLRIQNIPHFNFYFDWKCLKQRINWYNQTDDNPSTLIVDLSQDTIKHWYLFATKEPINN